ncbi:MAG: endonuclease III [Alphaproteobacteria bacterium]|nr:endonuclease III [Alphaproteobacteria bacterium]
MKNRVNLILEALFDFIGHRKSELNYFNPYTFAVAVLLSAQSTDKGVNIATVELFKVADTPGKMLDLGEEKLKKLIKRTGFFNMKSKHIIAMSEILERDFEGELPATRDLIETLPGLGRKSANVIMNELYDAPYIGVDTHVMRVAGRLGFVPKGSKNPIKIEEELLKIVPKKWLPYAGHLLVLFGRYTCMAKKPKCEACPLWHRGLCKGL